ncbi:MAG: DUF488 domain-containing protein [Rhodospirillales bacterium]
MNVFTIGFTKTTAEHFFSRLITEEIKRLIDVRLKNTSQLSGFAKAKDLEYFSRLIGGIDYVHEPLLAPSETILKAYKKEKGEWDVYEKRFMDLMSDRRIEERLSLDFFDKGCLLCSEAEPHNCHRRLVVEYLNGWWDGRLKVKHL